MVSPYVTDLALRAAVNSTNRDLSQPTDQMALIQGIAMKRAHDQINANTDVSAMKSQIDAQSAAIGIAIAGIGLAYMAISKQMEVLDSKRLAFDKERQAGIATFLVPVDKEESDLSIEEQVMESFLALSFENASFSRYLGVHSAELLTEKGAKFYSVLPFYRMSEALGQPVASSRPLDRQRTAINLFFRSALPDAIADIDTGFQTDSKLWAFGQSILRGKNYLNDRRAPRFIIMSLSNLLWNLQHPVDPETGYPLSLDRCIEICRDVELFLNQLLNPDLPPYVLSISNSENGLLSFLRKLEIHTKALRSAYAEERLHELNIDDITNSAHRALRIMDKSVFKLIYKRHNPLTRKDEPDEKSAEELAYTISYLNQLLICNPDLISYFNPTLPWLSKDTGINTPIGTVIDVLILCCHISWRDRNRLLEKIKKSATASAFEFAQTLEKFDKKFIKPIKAVSKIEVGATSCSPKFQAVGTLTASRLIPLITLVIEDHRVDVDTVETYESAKKSAGTVRSGKQQVEFINASAKSNTGYYHWILSPFVSGAKALDDLPKNQYRMTQITKLMDSVSEIVKHYRSFLQNKSFQNFLLKCLNNVKRECAVLEKHINDADSSLAHDERISRGLNAILRPMTGNLTSGLAAFTLAAANFERVVSAPDFTDQQRQLLSTKLTTISEQFSNLFDEDSGIKALLDGEPGTGLTPIPIPTPVTAGLILPTPTALFASSILTGSFVSADTKSALEGLVKRCYDGLSYHSRQGHKGALLSQLLAMVTMNPNLTEPQMNHVLLELIHVTASYRETFFCQAAYGQTRSAKVLIAAIKDQALNSKLPLASMIVDASDGMADTPLTDDVILKRLQGLREKRGWEKAVSKVNVPWGAPVATP